MTRISRAFWITAALGVAVFGAAQAQRVSEEAETNRRGGDYNSFEVRDLRECQRACEREDRCQAYTYYELETKCFLKDRVPGAEKTRYQTSGVKERRDGGGYSGGGGGYGRLSEEEGVDYPGGDYSSFRAEDLEDCQSSCRRDRRCEGYTYYETDDRCYLKERIGRGKRNDKTVSGVKGGGRPSYPGSGGGRLSEENGQDYKGGDYDNFRSRDLSACQDECRRENRCVAYTYYPRTGACYLKDRLGNLERNKESITGRKRR